MLSKRSCGAALLCARIFLGGSSPEASRMQVLRTLGPAVCIHLHTDTPIQICKGIKKCVYIYIYVYMHMYIHIYICIYIYIYGAYSGIVGPAGRFSQDPKKATNLQMRDNDYKPAREIKQVWAAASPSSIYVHPVSSAWC